jgi:quinol monooxygenase YgiN
MLAVLVEFRIRSAMTQAFHAAIVANARQSVTDEPGCHRFDVCRDPADPSVFFLYELYDDEAAFAAHLRTPHFQQMNTATADWVEAKSVRQMHLVTP